MTDFMSGDDDATETAGVLDDCNTVDLLQSLVNNASAPNVSES